MAASNTFDDDCLTALAQTKLLMQGFHQMIAEKKGENVKGWQRWHIEQLPRHEAQRARAQLYKTNGWEKAWLAESTDDLLAASKKAEGGCQSLDEMKKQLSGKYSPDQVRRELEGFLTALPFDATDELCATMDKVLAHEFSQRKLVDAQSLVESGKKYPFYMWQGDITLLKIDAIVNAANSAMLGCFTPYHKCIDNVINRWAGPRLRTACRVLMAKQDDYEGTGLCKATPSYALQTKMVMHTIGPIIPKGGPLRPDLLGSCYTSVLDKCVENNLSSVAFCCISTGVFGYPSDEAAKVALQVCKEWWDKNPNTCLKQIVFNVFMDKDKNIYQSLMGQVL